MQVVVLNADYSQINVITWKRAFALIEKGKVEIVKYTDNVVQNFTGTTKFRIPAVIKLVNFVKGVYKGEIKFSKRFVQLRDNKTCSYCGATDQAMTIDHVIPISKGGETSWTNCVCCCKKCNSRKGNKSLKEVGMKLLIVPRALTMAQFLKCKIQSMGFEV